MVRRIISVSLPHWPIERWRRAAAAHGTAHPETGGTPFALTGPSAHGPRLIATDETASAAGLMAGMALTNARARLPGLRTAAADPAADARALRRLARWAGRYSPWTNSDGADGLWLDISGAAHLFGGEAALCRDIQRRFAQAGFHARIGLADTPGAAWAVARFGRMAINIIAAGQTAACLAPLPVAALRLEATVVQVLQRFGLDTIGALAAMPRASLKRRFAATAPCEAVLLRLDQALGKRAEPITPLSPPPRYRTCRNFTEPLLSLEAITATLHDLHEALILLLYADGIGARRLAFHALRNDGGMASLRIAFSAPNRTTSHALRLFAEKLPLLDPGFGIDGLILAAERVEPMPVQQNAMAGDKRQEQEADLHALLDRFTARFGAAALSRLRLRQCHLPEQAQARCGADDTTAENAQAPAMPRPLFLLPRPEPVEVIAALPDAPPVQFIWRRVRRHIARANGPERILAPWWRQSSPDDVRDYYRVEDVAGRRYWLYRAESLDGTVPLRWYVHGLFP